MPRENFAFISRQGDPADFFVAPSRCILGAIDGGIEMLEQVLLMSGAAIFCQLCTLFCPQRYG